MHTETKAVCRPRQAMPVEARITKGRVFHFSEFYKLFGFTIESGLDQLCQPHQMRMEQATCAPSDAMYSERDALRMRIAHDLPTRK